MLLESTANIPAHVTFRELQGETILLDLDRGLYFGLNEVGGRIWAALAASQCVRDTIEIVLNQFPVEREAVQRDVVALITQLETRGLLQIQDAGARPSTGPHSVDPVRRPYVTPALHDYGAIAKRWPSGDG